MTSRIIRFEVMVVSLGLWLITLIILDIKKPNLLIVLLYIEGKKNGSRVCFFTDDKQHKACKLDMITLGNDMVNHDLECPRQRYCSVKF